MIISVMKLVSDDGGDVKVKIMVCEDETVERKLETHQ